MQDSNHILGEQRVPCGFLCNSFHFEEHKRIMKIHLEYIYLARGKMDEEKQKEQKFHHP